MEGAPHPASSAGSHKTSTRITHWKREDFSSGEGLDSISWWFQIQKVWLHYVLELLRKATVKKVIRKV